MSATKRKTMKPSEQPSQGLHVHSIRTMPCKGKGVSVVEVRAGTAVEAVRAATAVWDCLAASKEYLMIDKRPGTL